MRENGYFRQISTGDSIATGTRELPSTNINQTGRKKAPIALSGLTLRFRADVIPAPPSIKPVAFYDTECYPNYWLLKFRLQGERVFTFSLQAGQRFDDVDIANIKYLFDSFGATVVSFNGNYYDVPMIAAALAGYSTEQLKWLSDQIIVQGLKPWELGLPEWKPADHIDICEVLPGAGSQKMFAGRIHYKTMRDLPYEPNRYLSAEEISEVADYCENDLGQIEAEYTALAPQLQQREELSKRYGMDLRSKSDAQLAEAVLKQRCEQALGQRIYKPEIDWNLAFRYEPPAFLSFEIPQLQRAFNLIKEALFTLGASGRVEMPSELEGLEIELGSSRYRLGIGGLHSSEKRVVHRADADTVLRDADVASYYPSLILNSGKFPLALGPAFLQEYGAIKDERLAAKALEKQLKKAGDTKSLEYLAAHVGNEGGKIMINGTFGKTGSPFSVLFAPEMLIQTTVTGQLALLMLIEWHEFYGIPVVSANTDGIVIKCPRSKLATSDYLIKEWERRTGLEMETSEYAAIYSRDINNYFAVKTSGEVKRKGEYSKAGLVEKKSPDVEICSDAVAEYLSKGTPIIYTLAACRDIRKFVTVTKVTGGAVKLWGEGPSKEMKVANMTAILLANGWSKSGRKWVKDIGLMGEITDARSAYKTCFAPQRPEYLGKVIRWYYSAAAPGPIIYNTNGNQVSLSYGAKPCMTLPDEFPADIDYDWYLQNCESILRDIGAA
jgi:hypothetical protein